MEIVIGLDALIVGFLGLLLGALPTAVRAIWRECVERRKQKERLAI